MVSHELRTPLTSIDGYISLFLAGATGPVSVDQKKYLKIIRENDERLANLIDRLLDFSKIETGQFRIKRELLALPELVDRAVEAMKPQLDKTGAVLKIKQEAKNVNIMGDQEKLSEVFFNLIENSIKFRREGEAPVIEITSQDAGDFIQMSVADQGIGLEPEQLEKIFNKFYQVEETMTRRFSGVGLGLAIVKEIIGNHQGRIWAESAGKNQGARFVFVLPVAEKA